MSDLTPNKLRDIALWLDTTDEVLRDLIPHHPTATEEAKEGALGVVSSDELQQDLRRWADALESAGYNPEDPIV